MDGDDDDDDVDDVIDNDDHYCTCSCRSLSLS